MFLSGNSGESYFFILIFKFIAKHIKIYSDSLFEFIPNSPFAKDVVYTITLFPFGSTSYSLCESLYAVNNKKFSYIYFRNGDGYVSMRTEDGQIVQDNYKGEDISSKELVLRQISNPQRYQPSPSVARFSYGHPACRLQAIKGNAEDIGQRV